MMAETVKVLHYSTHNEDCGIGKYQEQFLEAMKSFGDVKNDFFKHSPNQTRWMSSGEFTVVLNQLLAKMKDYDILHIQHELSFYKHQELARVIPAVQAMGKKVMVTVHTALEAEYRPPSLGGLGPRSWLAYWRSIKIAKQFQRTHSLPLAKANLILVHNSVAKASLVKHGVAATNIDFIDMPVPAVTTTTKSSEIAKALTVKSGDIIFATVGFVSATKGVDQAIKALSLLPKQYKLAIIGGLHPKSDEAGSRFMDELSDLIAERGLTERVYITGYIKADARLNALVREADICVYPYDQKYYGYVSSASLSNALANYKPTIVYPTKPFLEINKTGVLVVCETANYYELARSIQHIDLKKQGCLAKDYAQTHSYPNVAKTLDRIYHQLASL